MDNSKHREKLPDHNRHQIAAQRDNALRALKAVQVAEASVADLRSVVPVYREMLLATLDAVIERSSCDPDYPFIDTKIDIFTGKPLSCKLGETDVFGRETVYAWIQSRGVEALCGHARWIRECKDLSEALREAYMVRIRYIVERVVRALESARRANGGSLFFWMDVEGRPFTLDAQGRKTALALDPAVCYASDMFHVKALAAAAEFLDDPALRTEASRYFARWISAVREECVRGDQQPFDPKNPVTATPDRRSHGLRMITLGALALYARLDDDPAHVEDGLDFIRHILENHVNTDGRFPGLEPWDFVEFIDAEGAPYRLDGHIVCDPGHALEFVGLGFKFMNEIRGREVLTPSQLEFISACDRAFPRLLRHAFALGYNEKGGICKTYALDRRAPLNSDMPWWNLPETMRAAIYAHNVASNAETQRACLEIARRCSNAFLKNYVRPEFHGMAYQTLDQDARPVPVIPATPDLDPGYHTGLSVIDFMDALALADAFPLVS